MDFCEENPQLSIRNHMNSNKGKSQFHVKPNVKITCLYGAESPEIVEGRQRYRRIGWAPKFSATSFAKISG
jgi:hypothetical protein